jgi:peptidoglycan-associated lipoprotein
MITGCTAKKDVRLEMTRETVIHPPEITGLSLDPSGKLDTRERGHTVTVRMEGDPGLTATFDVEGRVEAQPMNEVQPGVYQGAFQVSQGEKADLWVVGHLVHEESGAEQSYRAPGSLSVEPLAKVVKRKEPVCEVQEFDGLLRRIVVYFPFDSAALGAEGQKLLSGHREMLAGHPQCTIFVLGHADQTGPKEYNDGLSIRRAEAVSRYLESIGIANTRIVEDHLGESHPADETDHSRNRRVELRAVNPYRS